MWGALTTSRPAGSSRVQEKSSRSLMLVETAVRCSLSPISRAMLEKRWLMSSSSTAWGRPREAVGDSRAVAGVGQHAHPAVTEGPRPPARPHHQGAVLLLDQGRAADLDPGRQLGGLVARHVAPLSVQEAALEPRRLARPRTGGASSSATRATSGRRLRTTTRSDTTSIPRSRGR